MQENTPVGRAEVAQQRLQAEMEMILVTNILESILKELKAIRHDMHMLKTGNRHVDINGCICLYNYLNANYEAWECTVHGYHKKEFHVEHLKKDGKI